MRTLSLSSRIAPWVVLSALASGGTAQEVVRSKHLQLARWHEAWLEPSAELGHGPAVWPEVEAGLLKAPEEHEALAEELAARIAVEPPPVSREALDGTGERQRFRGLPGGIVLGTSARVPGELAGARLEGVGAELVLRLADGSLVRLPVIERGSLRACVEFAAQGLDGLIDLSTGRGDAPRLAAAFAGGELGGRLVRMDALPHQVLPETRAWKSVIVDREVRAERWGDTLEFAAELEVRFYDDGAGAGWARRVCSVDAPGVGLVGPRAEPDLGRALAPLGEIAGWLGFLRWLAGADPLGFAELRAELARRSG